MHVRGHTDTIKLNTTKQWSRIQHTSTHHRETTSARTHGQGPVRTRPCSEWVGGRGQPHRGSGAGSGQARRAVKPMVFAQSPNPTLTEQSARSTLHTRGGGSAPWRALVDCELLATSRKPRPELEINRLEPVLWRFEKRGQFGHFGRIYIFLILTQIDESACKMGTSSSHKLKSWRRWQKCLVRSDWCPDRELWLLSPHLCFLAD